MRCSVKDILKSDGEIAEISGVLEYETLENNGDEIKFITPIEFSGEVKNESGNIIVNGEIEFDYEVNCHRCGEVYKSNIKFPVSNIFSVSPSEDEYLLKGDILDLEDMLVDNIRLNLPVKFLCKEDCKGRCATCGTNLNNTMCNCEDSNIDARLAVFSNLLS